MKKISYQVQGSAKEPYNITIALDGTNISCVCDCPAGLKGSHCKHWMLVFEGGKQKYIGLDENQIAEIQSWLPGSNLDEPWQEFNKIKDQEKQIMAEIKEKKKEITKKFKIAMRGGPETMLRQLCYC